MEVGCFPGRETFVVYKLGEESLIYHYTKKIKKFLWKSLEEGTNLCPSAGEAVHSRTVLLMVDCARELLTLLLAVSQ